MKLNSRSIAVNGADTPQANRLHIALFGRRNSGKSSLINALTGQHVSLVSEVSGTTTDPVRKAMEVHGIGPCVFIDTAGFDDEGELGELRNKRTLQTTEHIDVALLLCRPEMTEELRWLRLFREKNIPVVLLLNKSDLLEDAKSMADRMESLCHIRPLAVSAKKEWGIEDIIQAIKKCLPDDDGVHGITDGLIAEGESVLLVMPQDIQAPKGRLILPQVQTLRELLDKRCVVTCSTVDKLNEALSALVYPPHWIITDSQAFKAVFEKKPKESRLTSFSVLYARYKGDIQYYVAGASVLKTLNESSRILIAEACTHVPLTEDIGRVKLPRLLRQKIGEGVHIDIVSGDDFPEDISAYSLVIQCGACMFNRKYVQSRIGIAREQGIPMTNYGIAIACLNDILDKISY